MSKQFYRYGRLGITEETVLSAKVAIPPIEMSEKKGWRWGSVAKSHGV